MALQFIGRAAGRGLDETAFGTGAWLAPDDGKVREIKVLQPKLKA